MNIENNSKFTTVEIEDSLSKILTGLNKAADIITSTMGGAGKNVIINSRTGLTFTKDGVSVADSINLKDPIENVGAKMLIDATNKTVDQCGDGTTLTALLTQKIIEGMLELNKTMSINDVIDTIDNLVIDVEKQLTEKAQKIETVQQIFEIAKTSAKSPSIGKLISEIYTTTGFGAKISVELSKEIDKTYYQLIEGLSFDGGLINSRFANQEEGNSCVLENCQILLENEIVNSIDEYRDIFNDLLDKTNSDKSLVIIAPQFSDNFIKFCITNKIGSGLKVCLIKSPGYGKAVIENYKDIIAFSSNMVVDKVVITPYDFTIFNRTNSERIAKRVAQLTKLAASAVEKYDEQDYLQRIERLKQTGAIIYVGGVTLKNAKEEYDRIEDAVGAVASAFKAGYVRGAGCELANITYDNDYKNVIKNVYAHILMSPVYKILANGNISKIVDKVYPYNVVSKKYDSTIIDPAFVLINAFKNANALAKLLINTSYTLHNE